MGNILSNKEKIKMKPVIYCDKAVQYKEIECKEIESKEMEWEEPIDYSSLYTLQITDDNKKYFNDKLHYVNGLIWEEIMKECKNFNN